MQQIKKKMALKYDMNTSVAKARRVLPASHFATPHSAPPPPAEPVQAVQ